jgi:hypothetical protein
VKSVLAIHNICFLFAYDYGAGRRKLDHAKIHASLNVKRTLYRAIIPPDKRMRIDFERMKCARWTRRSYDSPTGVL